MFHKCTLVGGCGSGSLHGGSQITELREEAGVQRGGRPLVGRQRRCLKNKCPVLLMSFLGNKVYLVIALFLVQAPFQRKFRQLRGL